MEEIIKELGWLCEKYHMTREDAIEILKLQALRKIEADLSILETDLSTIETDLSDLTSCTGSNQDGHEAFNKLMEKIYGKK